MAFRLEAARQHPDLFYRIARSELVTSTKPLIVRTIGQ
jgi:hypothetical protein